MSFLTEIILCVCLALSNAAEIRNLKVEPPPNGTENTISVFDSQFGLIDKLLLPSEQKSTQKYDPINFCPFSNSDEKKGNKYELKIPISFYVNVLSNGLEEKMETPKSKKAGRKDGLIQKLRRKSKRRNQKAGSPQESIQSTDEEDKVDGKKRAAKGLEIHVKNVWNDALFEVTDDHTQVSTNDDDEVTEKVSTKDFAGITLDKRQLLPEDGYLVVYRMNETVA